MKSTQSRSHRSHAPSARARAQEVNRGESSASLLLWLGLLLALTLFASQARAHEAFYPIAADAIAVSEDGFSLEASGQEAIVVGQLHDPNDTTTGVIIVGSGDPGDSTGFITLDPTKWSYDEDTGEWRYSDPASRPRSRENRCTEAKVQSAMRALGCRAKARAHAYRKATEPDFSACEARLSRGFESAHRRYRDDCPSRDDLALTQTLVEEADTEIEVLCGRPAEVSSESSKQAPEEGQVCSAKRAGAQRHFERCMSRQDKRVRKSKQGHHQRCERQFSRRLARIEARYGSDCPTAASVEEIALAAEGARDDIYTAIRTGGEGESSAPGGITSVVIGPGSLSVAGSGPEWSWEADSSQEQIWVQFRIENEWFCAAFSEENATVETNSGGEFVASAAAAPGSCLTEICGNGVVDEGSDEECDDGNLDDADSCRNTCVENLCVDVASADSTFEGIQKVIFDGYCTSCHSSDYPGGTAAGDLDLSPGVSYAALYGQPSSAVPAMNLVVAGERRDSFLYEKIAAKTLGGETTLASMPSGLLTVSEAHLEALGRWISAGAPESLSVEGTADLLETCLPPADPLKIDPVPSAPPPELGVQLQQTAWPLYAESEDELCMATYYDFSAIIPEEHQLDCSGNSFGNNVNNPTGKCFYYDETLLIQDAQSHHSIIKVYVGDTPVDFSDEEQCVNEGAPEISCNGDDSLCDSSLGAGDGECSDLNEEFGPWTFRPNYPNEPGAKSGPCDPKDIDLSLGYNPDCSGAIVSGVACTGYGPQDAFRAPSFAGSQEAYSHTQLAEGVFRIQPISGVVIWNSHAFNLTTKDSSLAQYLDLFYGEEGKRDYYGRGIFDASKIFVQQVPPFETVEYCQTYTVPENSRVFSLSSHTHLRGVRFRVWEPPNDVCELTGVQALPCADTDGDRLADCPCEPGDPDQLIYYSTSYTDPIALKIDPPMAVGPSVEERTFLYCSLFDNGSTEDSPPVKRQSTSPSSPPFALGDLELGQEFEFGGPCPDEDTPIFLGAGDTSGVLGWRLGVRCMDNTDKKGQACYGDHALCDSSEGEGDGVCDACFSMGGFTTEDEMYILLGSYYIGPTADEEPEAD